MGAASESEGSFSLPYASTDLTGQVALVTGASAGLGRRFASTLAAAGAHVVAAGRRTELLEELADEIAAAGRRCEPVTLDVTDVAACDAVFDRAEAVCGPVTILVNNAGIPDAKRAHKMPIELIDAVIATNLRGPFLLSTAMARRLIKAGLGGRIVNISSIAAFNYSPGSAAALYATTKAAINRMTEVLAVEWLKYGINVNAIAPGSFWSEMHEGLVARVGDVTQHMPRKRIGDPAQLDSTLLYLVAPSSELVTGTVVRVDDGQGGR